MAVAATVAHRSCATSGDSQTEIDSPMLGAGSSPSA